MRFAVVLVLLLLLPSVGARENRVLWSFERALDGVGAIRETFRTTVADSGDQTFTRVDFVCPIGVAQLSLHAVGGSIGGPPAVDTVCPGAVMIASLAGEFPEPLPAGEYEVDWSGAGTGLFRVSIMGRPN